MRRPSARSRRPCPPAAQPSPAGTNARPSEWARLVAEPEAWLSWARATTTPSFTRSDARTSSRRSGERLRSTSSRARSGRATARPSPCRARSSGSPKSAKVTIALAGLPGSPRTCASGPAAQRERLARLDGHAPEVELHARALERGAHDVVIADAHAAHGEQHVRPVERLLDRAPGACGSSRAMGATRTSAPACRASAPSAALFDSGMAPGLRALAGHAAARRPCRRWSRGDAERPAARRCRTSPRARAPRPTGACRRRWRRRPAGMSSPAKRTCWRGCRARLEHDGVALARHVLLHHHRVGADRGRRRR